MALPLNRGQLYFLLQLLLLGLLVGLACWPLNLVDHVQDLLLQQLPNFAGGAWTLQGLAIEPRRDGLRLRRLLQAWFRLLRGLSFGVAGGQVDGLSRSGAIRRWKEPGVARITSVESDRRAPGY